MAFRRCDCQRIVKTMSFRRREREGTGFRRGRGFRHILPVDNRLEAGLASG